MMNWTMPKITRFHFYGLLIVFLTMDYMELNNAYMSMSEFGLLVANNASLIKNINIDESSNHAKLSIMNQYNQTEYYTIIISSKENFLNKLQTLTSNITSGEVPSIQFIRNYSFQQYLMNVFFGMVCIGTVFWLFIDTDKKKESKDKNDKGENGLFNISFGSLMGSDNDFYTEIKNSDIPINFSDIIGLEPVKDELAEFIKYMKFPKDYSEAGCSMHTGLLFTGPSGVGKTMLAKAFAHESKATFLYTTGSSFNHIYIGTGSKRVKKLFDRARKQTPCVIFIDEIDAFGSRNDSGAQSDSNEIGRTINALLAEMDGMVDLEDILVIGATNLPDKLDPALTRSGRFDKTIKFDYPTLPDRVRLFEHYLEKITLDHTFDKLVDVKLLATNTARLTGADIKNICNQGILHHMKKHEIINDPDIPRRQKLANRSGNSGCTLSDLLEAIDDIAIGNKRIDSPMSKEETKLISYHEMGHTLINSLVSGGSIPLKVSIISRADALGFTMEEPKDKKLFTKSEIICKLCTLLGGRAAEELVFGNVTTGASDDFRRASKLASEYFSVYNFGLKLMSTHEKSYSESYKTKLNELSELLIQYLYCEVFKLLETNRNILDALATKLLDKETMGTQDIKEIISDEMVGSVRIQVNI